MELKQINRMPMPTFRWLKINDAEPLGGVPGTYKKELPLWHTDRMIMERRTISFDESSANEDLKRSLAFTREGAGCEYVLTVREHADITEPVILDFRLDDENCALYDLLQIKAEKGSRATIVLRYTSAGLNPCFHSGFTVLELAEKAEVKLIIAQMLSGEDRHAGAVSVIVGPQAHAEVILGELGSVRSVGSCNIELLGGGSKAELSGLYAAADAGKLDLNYRIGLRGKESEGEIVVKGALAGQARKVLKSTVDFIKGAAGAKGREEETVLVLSDAVVNLSAPLLLCGEDNVEGEHATSTGKPDEGKLYYLMSRGFSEEEAKKLIVEASFTPILNKLEPESLRMEWKERIQEVMHGED